jgi:hypothetical protein
MIQRLTTVAQSRLFHGGRQSRRLGDSWRLVTQLMMGTVALVDLDPIVCVPGGVMKRIREQLIDNAQQRCEALGAR